MTSTDIYIELLSDRLASKNKYFFLYTKLIDNFNNRNQTEIISGERHHIYPVCFCDRNNIYISDKLNKILVTPREHFILHRVLSKMHFKDEMDARSMDFAVSCFMRSNDGRNINSRQFELARLAAKNAMTGRKMKDSTKEKLSKSRKGRGNFYDNNGNSYFLETTDERIKDYDLVGNRKNYVMAKDMQDNFLSVKKDDPRFSTGEIVGIMKNMSTYISETGKKYTIDVDSPLIAELNLKHINAGKKIPKPKGHSKGHKNSMYGRTNEVCCFDLIDKVFLRIDKETFDSNSRYVGVNNKTAKKYRKISKHHH